MHGSGGMIGPGSGEHFLDFHRNFIKNLENALINRGKNQYVPLPKWNPADPIPAEFSHPGRSTNNPGISPPSWITLAGGSIGDPVFGYTSLGQFKSSDELGRALGSDFHGLVHMTIGGDMNSFRSPQDPIFYPWHAFLDDLWSDWQNSPNGKSRCFIATAAYGSDLEPPVRFLRNFRDNVVLQSRFQKPFNTILNVYYSFSPPIADAMYHNNAFKHIMKYSIVLPFVVLARTVAFLINPFIVRKSRS